MKKTLFTILSIWVLAILSAPALAAEKIPYFDTAKIERALKTYEKIAERGGWQKVPWVKKLELGKIDSRVAPLRERLKVTDDFSGKTPEDPNLFDENLKAAVEKFQKRHGLNVDGVVGRDTLQALNVTVERRIQQIQVTLERLKNLPLEDLEDRYILVNVPAYHLDVIEKNKSVLEMRVITGKVKRDHRTPLFSREMKYLVLNPAWNVPESIAVKEMLPKIQKDPEYLAKKNYQLIGKNEEGKPQVMDPSQVDWSQINKENFTYRFKQKSGRGNSLGKIKFMFPNRYNVYLHDTNGRYLFKRNIRAFSHGCVRLEKPFELAEYVLKDQNDGKWSQEKIKQTIRNAGTKEKYVNLEKTIPVHLIYHTVWVANDGEVQFRRDIYGYDRYKYSFAGRKFLPKKVEEENVKVTAN